MSVMEKKSSSKIFFGSDNDALVMLIILNAVVAALIAFIRFLYQFSSIPVAEFSNQVLDWFMAPASLGRLAARPWTVVTFMFTHVKIWSLIANMLWLWAFGYILQDLAGNRRIAPIYLYGGLAGFLFFLLSSLLIPKYALLAPQMQIYGANASVMALAVAATVLAPNYRIFPMINGGIPLWILTVIYALMNFAGTASGYPPIFIAQIAGAGMGYVFVNRLQHGHDWGEWMHRIYEWFFNLFNPSKSPRSKSIRGDIFYNTRGTRPFRKTPNLTQQKVDEILDKINQKGYNHLSDEEKELLRRASEEDL